MMRVAWFIAAGVALGLVASPTRALAEIKSVPAASLDPSVLPGGGWLELADSPASFAEGPISAGQTFLSISVRHRISGMGGPVFKENLKTHSQALSEVLPTPARFSVVELYDEKTGGAVYPWCTDGRNLRAGPLCVTGMLDSKVRESGLGHVWMNNDSNPFLPQSLSYLTCKRACSTASMNWLSVAPDREQEPLSLEYVLVSSTISGVDVELKLGGQRLSRARVLPGGSMDSAAGSITLEVNDRSVSTKLTAYSSAEKRNKLSAFSLAFLRRQLLNDASLPAPYKISGDGDVEGFGRAQRAMPLTQVYSQPVALPENSQTAFASGDRARLFVDYIGAFGDTRTSDGRYVPTLALFVVGYARKTGGRWHLVVPLDGPDGGAVLVGGQKLLQVRNVDPSGGADIEIVGKISAEFHDLIDREQEQRRLAQYVSYLLARNN